MGTKKRNKKAESSLIRMLFIMLSGAGIAFFLFYFFLIDMFGVFQPILPEFPNGTTEEIAEEQTAIAENIPLDGETDTSPAHGDDVANSESPYPMEEVYIYARSVAIWLQNWAIKHSAGVLQNTIPFPVEEYVRYIASLQFSTGNPNPNSREATVVFSNALSPYLDAIFLGENPEFTTARKNAFKVYFTQSLEKTIIILDTLQELSPLQQKDFIALITAEQQYQALQQRNATINQEMKENAQSNLSSTLPALAEEQFALQNKLLEQEAILQRYKELFSSFYTTTTIRHLPQELVHGVITTFTQYTPVENWQQYAQANSNLLSTILTKLQAY